jgi:hypothetical protein
MSRRFFELAVLARRRVTPAAERTGRAGARLTARRQDGGELAQFSFRLAFIIDLAYVGVGAVGGAAVGRAALPPYERPPASCVSETTEPGVTISPGRRVDSDSSAADTRSPASRAPSLPVPLR